LHVCLKIICIKSMISNEMAAQAETQHGNL
jgi:hypothetical protein